jgi:hypothetical protein
VPQGCAQIQYAQCPSSIAPPYGRSVTGDSLRRPDGLEHIADMLKRARMTLSDFGAGNFLFLPASFELAVRWGR